MITIKHSSHNTCCVHCKSWKNVETLYISYNRYQGTEIALCDVCAKNLLWLLKCHYGDEENVEQLPPVQPQPKIIDDGDAVTILSRNTPYSFYWWAVIADMLKRCGMAFCERKERGDG